MDISVVVPVRDEADNVEPLLNEIRAALDGALDYEIIYINDGSTDGTAVRLAELTRAPRLRVLHHLEPCGQSAAIVTGVKAARADWIATLDGDGQNDPADIPRLWTVLQGPECPADLRLLVGHRRRRRDRWIKRVSSTIANSLRGRLLQDATPDAGCGLKLFSRDTFLELPCFDHMHRFLPALVRRAGGQVASVEVNHRPRARGVSKYGMHDRLWAGIVDLFGVMWLQRRTLGCATQGEPRGV